MEFIKRGNSYFPLLERALVEVFSAWARRVDLRLERANVPTPVAKAAEKLLAEILDHQMDYDGSPRNYASGSKLFIRSNAKWDNSWASAVGSRLRRVIQEAMSHSQTNVDFYKGARHVVILGAGASHHAGLPLACQITDRVLEDLERRKQAMFEEVQSFMRQASSRNFEELLGLLQTVAWQKRAHRQKIPQEEGWISQLLVSYKNVLLRAQYPRKGAKITQQFLQRVENESSGTWAIISFNQDTSVEYELEKMGNWSRNNGLGQIITGDFNASLPNRRVLKPHGSIALHRTNAWPLRGLKLDELAFKRRTSTRMEAQPSNDVFAPLILVPSFLKIYVDDFLSNMVARTIYELTSARRIIVAGFRLRSDDLLMSNIIRFALKSNNQAEVSRCSFALVGPDSDDVSADGSLGRAWAPIISNLAGKGWGIKIHPSTFQDYVRTSKTAF